MYQINILFDSHFLINGIPVTMYILILFCKSWLKMCLILSCYLGQGINRSQNCLHVPQCPEPPAPALRRQLVLHWSAYVGQLAHQIRKKYCKKWRWTVEFKFWNAIALLLLFFWSAHLFAIYFIFFCEQVNCIIVIKMWQYRVWIVFIYHYYI